MNDSMKGGGGVTAHVLLNTLFVYMCNLNIMIIGLYNRQIL